jgi:predicted HTH transcriptional regulator
MSKLSAILLQPEGRRLEFKESLPTNSDLAKTILAFANDAGGELYIGIKDNPREVVGLKEDDLLSLEEKIASLIHDLCEPVILPEITFLQHEGKHIIRTQVYKGSTPPYHLKNKTTEEGTFFRVGSTNRLASAEMIAELERRKKNISFDSELVYSKTIEEINISTFKDFFQEKTGEELTVQVLKKLELFRPEQGKNLPTYALILLSDDELQKQYFPYAKIECARFKGTVPGNFIDQKTIDTNVALQAEQAYQFVLRHISQGTTDYTGVYRNDRWEYPVIAIREIIRNAVIHRDYSLTGKDIKIAIFDDKVEITSPGKLMPTVDFSDMESGQSDIRNKILAPVFKKLRIIEQWGNGLKLISEELQNYPGIGFDWKEPGIAFRVTFTNKNFTQQPELQSEYDVDAIGQEIGTKLGLSWDQAGTKSAPSRHQVGTNSAPGWHQVKKILDFCRNPQSIQNIMELAKWKDRTKFRNKYITPLLELGIIEQTIPDKPTSSKQEYFLTSKGLAFLKILNPQT